MVYLYDGFGINAKLITVTAIAATPPRLLSWLRGLGGMKNLFIALLALTMTLGVACKKSNDVADAKPATEISKKEVSPANIKPNVLNYTPVAGGIDQGAAAYPHSTGLCICGLYSVCHPLTYYDVHGNGHATLPGQTTFPPGSTFPGNILD